MTDDSDASRLTRVLLGSAGFERATVWSAAGFGVSYVAFDIAAVAVDGLAALGVASSAAAGVTTPSVATVVTAVTAVGVAAFGATGGGVLPGTILAYGPLAAALLRTLGPAPYALSLDEGFAVALGVSLAVAVAAAVALGVVGSGLGRALVGVKTAADGGSDSPSTDGSDAGGATADD
ncbi:hypothetical protein [Halorubrum pallidum]